jgi:hypothetical protein
VTVNLKALREQAAKAGAEYLGETVCDLNGAKSGCWGPGKRATERVVAKVLDGAIPIYAEEIDRLEAEIDKAQCAFLASASLLATVMEVLVGVSSVPVRPKEMREYLAANVEPLVAAFEKISE